MNLIFAACLLAQLACSSKDEKANEFLKDDWVIAFGLTSEAGQELNDGIGVIGKRVEEKSVVKYEIHFENGERKKLKAENVRAVTKDELNEMLLNAVWYNENKKIERFLNAGANANYDKHRRLTPLISAVLRQNGPAVKVLLQAGANVNAATPSGATALHYAENESILRALLDQNGVNINSRDRRGTTALMSAASKGNARVVDILLKAGADATLKNYKGETALKLTENEKCKELIQLQAKI